MTKTIMLADKSNARTLEAHELAAFEETICGQTFQFVVTRVRGESHIALTHRASGKRVRPIVAHETIAELGGYEAAGRHTLASLIVKFGAARVRSVLSAEV